MASSALGPVGSTRASVSTAAAAGGGGGLERGGALRDPSLRPHAFERSEAPVGGFGPLGSARALASSRAVERFDATACAG